MKAITVQQPYAWAIIFGGKDVENRTQLWGYRGPLAIHAGMRWSMRGASSPLVREALAPFLTARQAGEPIDPAEHHDRLRFGAVIGVVELTDVHPEHGGCCRPWGESSYTARDGLVRQVTHLRVEDPRPLLAPIRCRGTLGLWTPPAEVLA